MIKKYVFMTEEVSTEQFLKIALKRLLPEEWNFLIIPHEGKQDMEKSIPIKLKAWRDNSDIQYQFVIIRDKDSGNCITIKNNLKEICSNANRDDAVIVIAIHELEAWFLGDLNAVENAYNINNLAKKQKNKSLYRNPDNIGNASQQLFKICNDRTKVARAKRITPLMNFENNISPGFNYFIRKINEFSGVNK